jgi:hypothetical protein
MALPTTRQTFLEFCLRALGAGLLELEMTEEQADDRVSQALYLFQQYHFDGNEVLYYKYQIEAKNFPDKINSIQIVDGGVGYTNGASITFTGGGGTGGAATIGTNANGTITSTTITDWGDTYANAPTATVSGGTGASLLVDLGGFIELPENVMGAVNIFDLSGGVMGTSSDVLSIQFQLMSTELLSLQGMTLVPYYTTMSHLNLVRDMLVGQQPIRYVRHKNRLYIDMNWSRVTVGTFIIAECYEVVDPEKYPKLWQDEWLQRYCTALLKRQWGTNLKKYKGGKLLAGMEFSGQEMYSEAVDELKELKAELEDNYSLSSQIWIG